MSLDDRIRWERQYGQSGALEKPAAFLKEILDGGHWDIARGQALDIASGAGRNALFLAEKGFDVTAVDIAQLGLDQGARRAAQRSLSISWQQTDLENGGLPPGPYNLIVNINYLQRSLVPHIKYALAPGGYIVFETYLIDQQTIGHPKNPEYLLAHNELLNYFRDLRVLCYREGKFTDGAEPSFRAGILAQKLR
jgi:tellurite methyltransferase